MVSTKRIRMKIIGLVSSLMLSVGLLSSIVLAPVAQAYPGNCSAMPNGTNGGIAICSTGTGYFQVVLGCKNIFGFYTNPTGQWKQAGHGSSTAGCPVGYSRQWVGFYAKD